MPRLTGLFQRGGSYYLRIMLPADHPLQIQNKCGRLVISLGPGSYRDASLKGTKKRAEVLTGLIYAAPLPSGPSPEKGNVTQVRQERLRDVYVRWAESRPRTADSLAACERALKLFESHAGNQPLAMLTRSQGDAFRAWLQTLPTTSKTARDRLNWVKVLLKYAAQDLEIIPKSPWTGLSIASRTTKPRMPWTGEHLSMLFVHGIWTSGEVPADKKAGKAAAYWLPLLALYTGARCSELAQLNVHDIFLTEGANAIHVTDSGDGQKVKSSAAIRTIPLHCDLVKLGFLSYVEAVGTGPLWPDLPKREGKPGGFFSQYFGGLRKNLGIPPQSVFHSFRHGVRTYLCESNVPETVIDMLLGHEPGGSVGARVYTHVSFSALQAAIEKLSYPTVTMSVMPWSPTPEVGRSAIGDQAKSTSALPPLTLL